MLKRRFKGTMNFTPGNIGTVPGVMGATPGSMPVAGRHIHAADEAPVQKPVTKPKARKRAKRKTKGDGLDAVVKKTVGSIDTFIPDGFGDRSD